MTLKTPRILMNNQAEQLWITITMRDNMDILEHLSVQKTPAGVAPTWEEIEENSYPHRTQIAS